MKRRSFLHTLMGAAGAASIAPGLHGATRTGTSDRPGPLLPMSGAFNRIVNGQADPPGACEQV